MIFFCAPGLLRLQQIYQGLKPGNESFQVETVKRITNVSSALDFLRTLEEYNRWSKKYVVLDCPTEMAKEIIVNHVRDVTLGRRTYHYLLSGLVSIMFYWFSISMILWFYFNIKKSWAKNISSFCRNIILLCNRFAMLYRNTFLLLLKSFAGLNLCKILFPRKVKNFNAGL